MVGRGVDLAEEIQIYFPFIIYLFFYYNMEDLFVQFL